MGDEDDTGQPAQETLTRNWDELLQEIRVTQTGVQILTGFLLTVPFSNRFGDLTSFQRTVYLVRPRGVGAHDRARRRHRSRSTACSSGSAAASCSWSPATGSPRPGWRRSR